MQFPMKFNNGQVFFINNRIENIKVAGMIQRLVNARVGIGHGQMEAGRIDVAFMNGEFDVLVATTKRIRCS
jgi:transcription-repair coupling factor (superfamily II helicase)